MKTRDGAGVPPGHDQQDIYDDDWVPPEMFGPDRAESPMQSDSVAPPHRAAPGYDTSDNDLLLPQLSELWPDEVPSESPDSTDSFDDDRIDLAALDSPGDSLAATMLQTAESFATVVPAPVPSPPQHAEPPAAAAQKPVESTPATPLPPAEPLTAPPLQQAAARHAPAADSPAYRPWVGEAAAENPVAQPPAATHLHANIPVRTLPVAPPIPPLRYESPIAPSASQTRIPEPAAPIDPPPARAGDPVAPPASIRAVPTTRPDTPSVPAPVRRMQEAQRPPQSGVQPREPRPLRPSRNAASFQALSESTEPLAAVKRSLSVLEKLLAMTVSQGASTLYLAANARPTIRLHGEVHVLDGTPALGRHEVDTLLRSLALAQHLDAGAAGSGAEWCFDAPAVGRVRCMTFRDHRGTGAVFRIGPRRAIAAEQLGLSVETQSLALERDGLVLVAGQRSSGKGAVIAGLLDLINRTRRAYVITVEREVNVSPERDGSFISQREARGGLEEMVAVARAALRENPDVLVLQELRSAPLVNLAFDAAASGQLVIAGFTAPSAGGAIDRIIKLYPRESTRGVQLLLAQHLRAIVSQVLVPKIGGGRVAAREVLLNTSAVAGALADGKAWEVPGAIEAGRKHGMVPFSDALAALVQSGAAAPDEAYRHAPDRAGFLEALKRHGIDPSSAVRFS